jgi:hypothetical protein
MMALPLSTAQQTSGKRSKGKRKKNAANKNGAPRAVLKGGRRKK